MWAISPIGASGSWAVFSCTSRVPHPGRAQIAAMPHRTLICWGLGFGRGRAAGMRATPKLSAGGRRPFGGLAAPPEGAGRRGRSSSLPMLGRYRVRSHQLALESSSSTQRSSSSAKIPNVPATVSAEDAKRRENHKHQAEDGRRSNPLREISDRTGQIDVAASGCAQPLGP